MVSSASLTRRSSLDRIEHIAERAAVAIVRTPRTVQRAAARVLPASPSAVTDMVERQTEFVAGQISHYWDESGALSYAEAAREQLSSVIGIHLAAFLLEAYGLSRAVLPMRHAFTLPGFNFLTSLPVSLPDFFLMLTSDFWSPVAVWATTSVIVPLAVAWFFNLTLHASKKRFYAIDPLMYSLTKGLLSFLVYANGMTFSGNVSAMTIMRVNAALPGGWFGVLISSAIGVVVSIYEAALRK